MKKILHLIILVFIFVSCVKKPKFNDPIPEHDTLVIYSEIIGEDRLVNIWTPPNYNQDSSSFPVLYMPDGGIHEDFPHIANTLSLLIENRTIPPIILVGIENTERGRDLSGFSEVQQDSNYCPLSDGAKCFRKFITDELMVQIDAKYRTTLKKGIIGESLAGLFVMETFLLTPNTFDFYIAMDPSLWWNNHYLERMSSQLLSEQSKDEIKLWFAGSDAADISIHTNNVAKSIENHGSNNIIWKYVDEPTEKHNTIFRATKEEALTWIFN